MSLQDGEGNAIKMTGNKFCPMVKADCRKEECAWWDIFINECAVFSMAVALWADVDEDDDQEDESGQGKETGYKKEIVGDEKFADSDVTAFTVRIKRLE